MSLSVDQIQRPLGTTEQNWCKAVAGGTGIAVLALLLAKSPDLNSLQKALRKLQISHPILNSKIRFDFESNCYSFVTSRTPQIEIRSVDQRSTAEILRTEFPDDDATVSPLQLLLEHELNCNPWKNEDEEESSSDCEVFFATLYGLESGKCVVALRVHTWVCDRASIAALLKKLLELLEMDNDDGEASLKDFEVKLPIEECIPAGQGNKPFWARGLDMLGYSLNSFRLGNLNFVDTVSPRSSRIVRLRMNADETDQILSCCRRQGIKPCALLAGAGMLATHSLKGIPDGQWEKYSVVTLLNCRSILDPVLSEDEFGFYHSAILNSHDVNGEEDLVELSKSVWNSFENSKNNRKHFTDMADMNFLMTKAIENPGLTPSASLRTSLMSVFEDASVIEELSERGRAAIGLEDFIGCSSVHGIGPSIAMFDVMRNRELDCAYVYPFPLHSREQMQELVDEMKRLLLEVTGSDKHSHN